MAELPSFDPFEHAADPYPEFARMRAAGGIAYGRPPYPELEGAYYVFSNELAGKALKHRSLLQAPPGAYQAIREQLSGQQALNVLTQSLLLADPPRHGELRRPLAPPLTAVASATFRQGLRDRAGQLAGEATRRGSFDAVTALAVPLSFWLLEQVMGVEVEDPLDFKLRTRELGRALDLRRDPADEASSAACAWIQDWAEDILRRGAYSPHGLVARMAAQTGTGGWSHGDAVANIVLLMFAGQETVVDAFGNAIRSLHNHPEQRERLANRLTSWDDAAQEFLRHDAPVQYAGARIAAEDLTLAGIRIRGGEAVVPVLASANRDETVFPRAEHLDLAREAKPHLTFGMGLHICLGQHVARLELAALLEALFTQAPEWRLDSANVVARPTLVFRGLQSAPLTVG